MILAQLTALKSKARHVRTRRLAESEDNGQLQTVVSLAQVLQHVLDSLLAAKGMKHKIFGFLKKNFF